MTTMTTVLIIIGILLVLDSLFALIFNKASKKMIKNVSSFLLRNNNIKKIASWELIFGILILIISITISL